jgi:hypothetical protein
MNPAPPEELAAAIREALGDASEMPSAEDMLRAAERLLKEVLRGECEARASAITLLTVDALVTQAMLIASGDANAPQDFPRQAMQRLAAAVE